MLRNVFSPCLPQRRESVVSPSTRPLRLTRTFVETGDERCPLAGIWLPLDESAATLDEAELTWPAAWIVLHRRAFHSLAIAFC